MAATPTTDQLLDTVRKSRLVDEKRLQAFLQSPGASQATNPRELAQQLIRQGLATPWQITQLLAGKWKGFLLAHEKYKLMDRLGQGGMGAVYLCEHIRMKRLVALKVLPTDKLRDDQTALERFDREARAAAALDHPNIARAHDIDTDGKMHFLVMEYVDGSSLQDIIKKHGPLDVVRACHYIADAAQGLQHAHGAGWVHRDIKPGNLVLDRTGTVKILDMGLARLFADDTDDLTKKYEKNAVLGTADYLAPEQATSSSDVDIRADIYSLGATFYYLLTGKPPFEDGTVTQKLIWHQTKPPKPIHDLRPDVPRELEVIINKMMAKKAVHRFQEPNAVVAALEPWTRQNIEPPADEEMPRLCPALGNYSAAGASLAHTNSTGPLSAIRSRGRGGPRSALTSRKMPRILAPSPWYKNKWVLIGGGGAAILLAVGIVLWITRTPTPPGPKGGGGPQTNTTKSTPKTTPSTQPGPSRPPDLPVTSATPFTGELPPAANGKLLVASGPNAAGRTDVWPTLTEAIDKASPGNTILVFATKIEEAVVVDSRKAGIHIESGLPNGQMVAWAPPANASADVPLLRIDSAGAVHIKGFAFDGSVRLNTLIQVSGSSAGLRLENLYLTDAGKKSIVLTSANSTSEEPVTLERVRITSLRDYTAPANQKAEAVRRPSAVECVKGSASKPLSIVIRWCRFEGVFLEAVLFECPVEAKLEFNRFYTLKAEERPDAAQLVKAVSIRDVPAGPVHVSLVSNTMARFTQFMRLDRLTPGDNRFQFTVRNNLILGSPGDSWVWLNNQPSAAVAQQVFVDSSGNVCRPGTVQNPKGLGDAVVGRQQIPFSFLEVVNISSDEFLRYKKTGDTEALLKAGADGGPVGVPPLD